MPSCSWNACIALREGDSVLLGILDKSILSSSAVMNELVTRNSIQEISGIGAFVNRIPAMWAFTAVFVLLAMTVLLVFAVITIVQRHKQETALAKKEAETDQKETELAATARANEEKDRFFSTISHDMRTPLNGIIGFAGLAEKSEDIKQVKDYLAKIRISGNLLLDLVNDTLTLSRINNGKIIMHLEPIDNYELMDYIAVPIRQAAEKDGVDFTIDTSKARKRKILADRLSIQKIFLNLLSNAVKFTPKNGHVLFAIETIPYDSHDAQTVFIVKDDGIGMSSSFIPRMFDPFSQEQRNPQDARGSGLGLSIVKQLVTCMGGTIDVQSEINKGTCFTVSLHFQEAPDDTESAISLPIYTYNKDFLSGKKILLCEDNELNVEIARALLEAEKMTVVCAKNGSEGVKIFEASGVREFDAVLMDLRMPVMDGYQSASGIRALAREDAATVPIIAMTADTLEDDVAMCREAGMNGHVSKPINPDMLYSKLAELCS
jgi:signal transduction histidine kinase